ncbi:hypothetical protein D7Y61_02115 [Stenotrophomonas maltophilia]|nr:hypothetical protein [Stenotrophomonas maltophilia]
MFWTTMMKADSDISNQVHHYAERNGLKSLPANYALLLSKQTTIGSTPVYTASPDDVLCGAPAGAVAMVSVYVFGQEDDLEALPEFSAHMARLEGLKRNAQGVAARSTQQQEKLLRDSQGGHVDEAQKKLIRAYQRQLTASISQSELQKSSAPLIAQYAATVNTGFSRMTTQERCAWAMGAFIAKNAKQLEASLASAQRRDAAQKQSSALGFGPAAPSGAGFDMDIAVNTAKSAKELEHKAFQLGLKSQ